MTSFQKPTSKADDKRERSRQKLRVLREVCGQVDRRDGFKCRCCRTPLEPMARHHHHVQFKSQGGNDTTDNLVLLCAVCHADIHAHRVWILGGNADWQLEFMRARSEPTVDPMRGTT